MSPSSKGEGTKIAQAAKDLNVTSVTIRRYLAEFNIATTSDENGVKVLPPRSMDELQEIRRLKEDGLTNPRVMELLEEQRAKAPARGKVSREKAAKPAATKAARVAAEPEEEPAEEVKEPKPFARRITKSAAAPRGKAEKIVDEPEAEVQPEDAEESSEVGLDIGGQGRSKHSLTCQTCGKVFEHMNPRLRDCLDCYRTKRKERRRGGTGTGDRHKNVIQHPLAQQATTKYAQQSQSTPQPQAHTPQPIQHLSVPQQTPTVFTPRQSTVRNYRKAIEETRHITSNLKRRLERPELPEGERRWLEQIYAYQLILHQGWRHLAEYKSANQQQAKADRAEARSGSSESRSDAPNY